MPIKVLFYIILPEVAHVADDPDPDKHGTSPKQDAADIITSEDLKEKKWTPTNVKESLLYTVWMT